jgi:putative transferase (TIGR04331 family)
MLKKNKENILVTAAIEDTFGTKEKIFFLGEWCKQGVDNSLWVDRDYETIKFYLSDREKFKRDHDYLEQFFDKVLESLVVLLNNYHGVQYSTRYWRIILGPWLSTYLPAVWSRWEGLRIAFEQYELDKVILLNSDNKPNSPLSHMEAMSIIGRGHFWNHMLYAKIIKEYYKNDIRIVEKSYRETSTINRVDWRRVVKIPKIFLKHIIDRIIKVVQKQEKIVFVTSYFSLNALVKISQKIGQLPRFYTEFDEKLNLKMSPVRARQISLDFTCSNEFELFIKRNIVFDIPVSYVEGYQHILNKAKAILPSCEVIFCANAFWSNELFKIWCAQMIDKEKKLIISEHGGSITKKYINFSHEVKISDINTVWHKPFEDNQIQLPPNIIVGTRKAKKNGSRLTIVGIEVALYVTRYQSGISSSLVLDEFYQELQFIRALDPIVMDSLIVRPNPNIGWNTRQRYIDELGVEKLSKHHSILGDFDNSKIIVCTYPETTFLEAMYSGVPTILLYKRDCWETATKFDDLIKLLEGVNILFSDSVAASNHINKIWNNPNYWWSLPEVVNAREEFFDQCGRVDDNWLEQWSDFFKEQLIN